MKQWLPPTTCSAGIPALCCLGLFCSLALGADSAEPLTTARQLAANLGRQAVVEFGVVEVKHPERRKAVFLTSSANFRSEEALAVMIRDADLRHFEVQHDGALAQRYVGRRIRVEGEIALDEGQLVVRISSPDKIRIVSAETPPPTGAGELVLTDEEGQRHCLSVEEISKLPQETCQIEHEGGRETYSGIPLAAILKHCRIVLGEESRGRQLSRYVLVRASDGYQALFSVAEVDPHARAETILLANRRNGQPLDKTEGPWRLVVKEDLHQRRWVRSVVSIIVRHAENSVAFREAK
jgi:hypothetical protein